MPDKRSHTLLWILIGGGAFFLFVLAVFSLVYLTLHAGTTDAGFSGFGDRIGVVDLDGVILSPQPVVGQLKEEERSSSNQNPEQGVGTFVRHRESLAPGS